MSSGDTYIDGFRRLLYTICHPKRLRRKKEPFPFRVWERKRLSKTNKARILIVFPSNNAQSAILCLHYNAEQFHCSLCVADFIFCLLTLPFSSSRFIHGGWIHGDVLCTMFPFMRYGNVGVSLLSIAMITINRWVWEMRKKKLAKAENKKLSLKTENKEEPSVPDIFFYASFFTLTRD